MASSKRAQANGTKRLRGARGFWNSGRRQREKVRLVRLQGYRRGPAAKAW